VVSEYAFILPIAAVNLLGAMSPGPSFVIVARTALAESKERGFGVSIGMGLGAATFFLMAAFGLYAVLEAIPTLYFVLKILGGAYLCYLAYKIIKSAKTPLAKVELAKEKSFFGYVLYGFAVQMSNPKTAIVIGSIVAAFLPREIPPMTPWLLALMGLATDFFWYSTVVLLFSRPKAQRGYLRFKAWIDRVAGGVLAALGLKLMVTP
jgi:threonine/homoserine/homoserine lactone efflux protein